MPTNHRQAITDLLQHTLLTYTDHQEDELLNLVPKADFFWGGAGFFIGLLSAMALAEADPVAVIDAVLAQVRQRAIDGLDAVGE